MLNNEVCYRIMVSRDKRFEGRFGTPIETGQNGITHLFPTAEMLARANLSGIGLPKSRASTIRLFSQAVVSKKVPLDSARDISEVNAALCSLPGIGDWTAQYIAMRALGEPDAFPSGDLGVRRALAKSKTLPSVPEVLAHAEVWRPFRSYATLLLWRSLT